MLDDHGSPAESTGDRLDALEVEQRALAEALRSLQTDVGSLHHDLVALEERLDDRFRSLETLIRTTRSGSFSGNDDLRQTSRRIEAISDRVDEVFDQWRAFNGRLGHLEGTTHELLVGQVNLASRTELVESALRSLKSDMDSRWLRADRRFDEVDDRLTLLDQQLGLVRSSLADVVSRLDAQQDFLAAIGGEQIAMSDRQSVLEGRISGVENRLSGVEDRLSGVEDRLSGVEDRLSGVEDRLSGVEERLSGVEDRVSRVDGTLLVLVSSVGSVAGAVDAIAATLGIAPPEPN